MAYERVARPHRRLTESVVLASSAGEVLHLEATAATVWDATETATEVQVIVDRLARRWPEIERAEIGMAVAKILADLVGAGVVREC